MRDAVVVPIGYACGGELRPPGDEGGCQLRIGRRMVELASRDEHVMWLLSRGWRLDGSRGFTRSGLLAAAREAAVREPERVLERLSELRAVACVASDRDAASFFLAHRLGPLLMGATNWPVGPERQFLQLTRLHGTIALSPEQFALWAAADGDRCLEAVVERLLQSRIAPTPGAARRRALHQVSVLVSLGAGYVDAGDLPDAEAGPPSDAPDAPWTDAEMAVFEPDAAPWGRASIARTPVVVPVGCASGVVRERRGRTRFVVALGDARVALTDRQHRAWTAAHAPPGGVGEPLESLRARLPGLGRDVDWLLGAGILIETDLDPTGPWARAHSLSTRARLLGPSASSDDEVRFGIDDERQASVGSRFGQLLFVSSAYRTIADAVRVTLPGLSGDEVAAGLFRCLGSRIAHLAPPREL